MAAEPPMDLSAKQSVSIKEMPSDIQLIGILPEEGFGKVAGPSPLRAPKGPAGSSLRKDHLRQPVIARIDPDKIARTLQRIHIRTAHRRDARRLHKPRAAFQPSASSMSYQTPNGSFSGKVRSLRGHAQ